MAEQRIQLTISIMVSGQPDNVRKCLESLKELRSKVRCELSITDTGCCPESRAIVEEYADVIYPFTWCKDFSKARNYGLERAKGEWFLFLDDDEWFQDMKDIIHFFTSGDERKYQYAYYIQRNYSNAEGSKYSDVPVLRMIRLQPDTHFVYSIHECLWPIRGEGVRFSSYVHHYGYVYENEEQHRLKAQRNIELLLAEHEKDPKDLHHLVQLVQEYQAIEEYEHARVYAEKGIDAWKTDMHHDHNVYRFMNALYAGVTQSFLMEERYEELLERGRMLLEQGEPDPLVTALIQGRLSIACYALRDFDGCLEYAATYAAAYRKHEKNPEFYFPYELSLTSICFEPNLRLVVLDNGIRAAIHENRLDLGQEWATILKQQSVGCKYLQIAITSRQLQEFASAPPQAEGSKRQQRWNLIQAYYQANQDLYEERYTDEDYEQRFGDLPESLRASLYLVQIYLFIEEGNPSAAVKIMGELLQAAPAMGEMIKDWLQEIRSAL